MLWKQSIAARDELYVASQVCTLVCGGVPAPSDDRAVSTVSRRSSFGSGLRSAALAAVTAGVDGLRENTQVLGATPGIWR